MRPKRETPGQALRRRREALHLTQAQLAERLDMHPNTVARWERDELAIGHAHLVDTMLGLIERETGVHEEDARYRQQDHLLTVQVGDEACYDGDWAFVAAINGNTAILSNWRGIKTTRVPIAAITATRR